jgi:hypothetical protein
MRFVIEIIKKNHTLYAFAEKVKRILITIFHYNIPFFWNNLMYKNQAIQDIKRFERRVYSQNGEDGIIQIIFDKIGVTNKYFVEFGVQDASECNCRYLRDKKGWEGLWMDAGEYQHPYIKKEFINAENVNDLFDKYKVPKEFDVLSIDIDFNDYWVWKAIKGYSPRVLIMEYNSSYPPSFAGTVKYDAQRYWDGTNYFGASLMALVKISAEKGYTLIGCDSMGVNAFFVRNDLLGNHFKISTPEQLFMPPAFGVKNNGVFIGHPQSNEKFIEV